MKNVVGSPGSWSGMALRVLQCVFSVAFAVAMCTAFGFSNYTAYCYLITVMALQTIWSFGIACVDIYSLKNKKYLHNPALVGLFIFGDWVTALLIFPATCAFAAAGVTILFVKNVRRTSILGYLS